MDRIDGEKPTVDSRGRFLPGEPLPEARAVLPDPEDLQAKFGPFEPHSNPYSKPQKGHKTPGQGQCEAKGFERFRGYVTHMYI